MSETYHLWHNGSDQGPFTREELLAKYGRGELEGVFWRRTGDTVFQPPPDLLAELSPADQEPPGRSRVLHALSSEEMVRPGAPDPKRPRLMSAGFSSSPESVGGGLGPAKWNSQEPEPSGSSVFGILLMVLGVMSILASISSALGSSRSSEAEGYFVLGVILGFFGMLCQIHAKLSLIAFRLRQRE